MNSIPAEYRKCVDLAIKTILENPADNHSLESLSKVVNYSPFHFQKIFRQTTGNTPKQFMIRLRLGNAAHSLIVHRHQTITEIALDSGFASPATFARAFKKYFGITADELRNLSPKEHTAFRRSINANRRIKMTFAKDNSTTKENADISVVKNSPLQVLYLNTPLSDSKKIQETFKKIVRIADAYDLITNETKFLGIINPHSEIYQASISLSPGQSIPKQLNITKIEGGKFAVCKIKGDTSSILRAFHSVYENWLPESGYSIRGHFAYEIFLKNPAEESYHNLERALHIPIEAR